MGGIKLFVPIIGVAVTIISASLTYFFAKKKQFLEDEKRIKEKFYLNYAPLSDLVVNNFSNQARKNLADAYNQILLVGSSEVVSKKVFPVSIF